ncbi:MAG: HDOD domain-containing protein [Ectothiorhodospiraceae bacterium]|nr:HDOD domain-containing protein [Ectothiorhodospiraceae bacterium]
MSKGPDANARSRESVTSSGTIGAAIERIGTKFLANLRDDLAGESVVWPSIPSVVVRVRDTIRDPNSSVDDICAAISSDPAVASRVVAMANSVLYIGMRPCDTLRDAIVRLGGDVLNHVVMVLVVARVFSVGQRRRIQRHLVGLWRHSNQVAALSERIAADHAKLRRDVALLAGLVHDVGKIPLLVQAERLPSVMGNAALLDALLTRFHGQAGHLVLDSWRFPSEITLASVGHESWQQVRQGPVDYVDVVTVANLLSHCDHDDPYALVPIAKIPAARRLDLGPERLATVVEEAAERAAELLAVATGKA